MESMKRFLDDLDKKLSEGEDDILNGNIYEARDVLEELKTKYLNEI